LNDDMDGMPYLALVDDDQHSAHLLTRMLLAHGSPDVQWLGGAMEGRLALARVLGNPAADWPSLLIVDLKAHSSASLEFVASIKALVCQKGVPVVAMTPPLDREARDAFYEAGASGVFFRHADRDAYRREAAGIVSFWARSQRLDAVGM
jgi:CheY-like chemotaxis protein